MIHFLCANPLDLCVCVACRPVGSDIGRGEKVLAAGDRLGPAELGILAAVGITTVGILTNAPVSTRIS